MPKVTNVDFRDRNILDIFKNQNHPEHENIK